MIARQHSCLLILSIIIIAPLSAQRIQVGLSMYLDYNLYHWYKKAASHSTLSHSSGQILNLLPMGGMGVWVGKSNGLTIGLEGGLDYMPFSFDTQNYKGLGAISFPVLMRFTQPFSSKSSIAPFLGVGLGVQWSRTEIYAHPSSIIVPINPYYRTFVAELSIGIGSGWIADSKQTGLIAFFIRIGSDGGQAFTLNTGIRAKLILNPSGKQLISPFKAQKERLYQAQTFYSTPFF